MLEMILLGVLAGIFTGLIPGIHVNLVALLVLSFSPLLLQHFPPINLAVFIICLAITHSFVDPIPSVYLGAPDEAQALNALPGHRLLNQGIGHNAIVYTLIGSLGCLILGLILFPIFIRPVFRMIFFNILFANELEVLFGQCGEKPPSYI